jgi:hypothetical protein
MLTLGQAARATGKAKVTLARAIKSGRLSAGRGDDGSYVIDPSELARVYPLTSEPARHMEQDDSWRAAGNGAVSEPGASPGEVEALRQRIAEQADTIRDLRTRLDASEEERRHEANERRRVQERLTALLTHRSSASVPAVQPAARASWWRRWFR